MIHLLIHKKAKSGFTLIELLVVIAIIGVLATVVLASLNNARRKSRDARRITDIKQIQIALEFYFDGTGKNNYPLDSATCDASQEYGLRILVTDGYISTIPRDPTAAAGSNCYRYRAQAAAIPNVSYHLAAVLEDSTNNALTQDKDCDDSTTACSGTAFAGAATSIKGATADCSTGATERCFDVVP